MPSLLDQFRQKVVGSVWKQGGAGEAPPVNVDEKIALGVLLWLVASADQKYLPQEEKAIQKILRDYTDVKEGDFPVVFKAIREAEARRVDLHQFTREVSQGLPYRARVDITEKLFQVACADGDLDYEEEQVIRQISGLFLVDHKDFISTKVKVKEAFGLSRP